MPPTAATCRNLSRVEIASDAVAALPINEFLEDASNHDGLGWLNFPGSGLSVIDVAEETAPGSLWQTTGASPLDFATHRTLSDLLAFELRCERLDRSQQLSSGCILEVLGDEAERDAMLLHFLDEDRDVGLLPTQAIEGVGQDDIDLS